ncbi:MFS transporter [Pontixanthobacter gangjinensis]|uniref:MFS transporter n=1 Tax=Pontixanthobacter gangjinensis TaxID=1028742 RepID=A0A6I4SRS9_9SPHN|nr:MFS transporter [Pontixanthobacter gangjinensis]MXO57627.1 MFS transporter [Pontixanthobacter gangjinensis]
MSSTAPKLGLWTKVAYGFGASAYGIKENGFGYFLLLYYGTVVGLEPGLVGLAILLALVVDAVSDPVVGYWSDNYRSRWGRRHPFMYAAAIPVAVSYFLLWNPPEWGQAGLFWYLLMLAILIRTFITFYETPSSALMPELTQDYDERTTVQAWRLFFAWFGGNLMSVLMFGVLLVATAQYPVGTLNRDGYQTYGIIASVLIFAAIMVSAVGTHHHIPHLRKPPERDIRGLKVVFRELFETLGERSFMALFIATLFGAVATGLTAALSFLMLTYFWGFSAQQIFLWTALVFISAFLGLLIAPRMVRRFGKKNSVVIFGTIAFSLAPMPVILRLFDLMPANGDPLLFPLVVTFNTIDLGLIIALQAVLYSMVADLVEQSELKTGRRSEGVFFAAITFIRKANQGLGAFAAGIVLSAISFPQNAALEDVPEDTIWQLGALLAPSQLLLWGCMILAVSRYKIGKAQHNANLAELAKIKSDS